LANFPTGVVYKPRALTRTGGRLGFY
jgi:hypothetical protein